MTSERKTFLSNLKTMTRTYDLDESRILDTIEQVLARVLAVRYRHGQVLVRLNERTLECDIIEYGQDGHIRMIAPERLTGLRNLEQNIIRALTELSAIETAIRVYQRYKKKVFFGAIRSKAPSGGWWVDLYVSDDATLVAECPAYYQTERDAGEARVGAVLPFYLSKVRVVDKSRVQVVVDRRSPRIPVFLLTEELKQRRLSMRLTCKVRRVGEYCEVLAERRIPRDIYKKVMKQMGEPMTVLYGTREQIRASRAKKRSMVEARPATVANQGRGWR